MGMPPSMFMIRWRAASSPMPSFRTDPKLLRAAKLLEWLQGQPGGMAGISAILTQGPNALRTKAEPSEPILGRCLSKPVSIP